ncbi:MAG TPA: DUF2442 domain-containing protein [Lacipirellulaceae bacterium]|nr:DUF2442 domain-containing protein [Lacipirellulaceae bacterium]
MRVLSAQPLPQFRLSLRFDDEAGGEGDLSSLAGRGVFAAWQEPSVFEQVSVTAADAVEWPGEIDLCPDALYLQMTGCGHRERFSRNTWPR